MHLSCIGYARRVEAGFAWGVCVCVMRVNVAVQLLKEEELGREVLSERIQTLRQMWEAAQDAACKVLPLAADTRSTYAGQMRRLEQLAEADKDLGKRG